VHCERLRKYFEPYAPVEYVDHHVKYMCDIPERRRVDGPLLWVGVRTNLPPLIDWLFRQELPEELIVLTNGNPRDHHEVATVAKMPGVRVEEWSPARHLELLSLCRGALDIKGDDFRQVHKPPTKAFDFIASGLPVALNSNSSSAESLRRMGFEPASPNDSGYWLSREYWDETRRFGRALRELLSLRRIGLRWRQLIDDVLSEPPNHHKSPAAAHA
jgi:hypothetical protein